uniref:C-type lectin domain-containing protein n=1 Tax=Globodera rostochiensis TaxID=31243 RepID=A0A914HNE7_GLORO
MNFPYFLPIVFALFTTPRAFAKTFFSCDDKWSKFGINCYKVFTFYGPYGDGFADSKGAKTRCEALDANLASIHGPKESQHVNALIRKSYEQCRQDGVPWCCDSYVHDGYWIGMTLARADNGTILSAKWSDGTKINYGHPLKTADQAPWYTPEHRPVQEAKASNNVCVFILLTNSGIGWADFDCDLAKIGGYVCKKKAQKAVDEG